MATQRFLIILATIGFAHRTASHAEAQLSLRDAFAEAARAGYANRSAAGHAAAQRAQALAPLKGILPNVRVEAGYLRTTDPTAVFGTTLRQRGVTQASFDPDRLNSPRAAGNYQTGVVLEQPLMNADAWAGRRAAVYAAGATRATEEWTQLSTRVDVVRAYYGAVLAVERVQALRAAARAAHAHVAQAEAMVRQGLVTKSDALLASVRAGDVDAQLAEAEGAAATTRRQLAVLLGRSGADMPNDFMSTNRLPPTDRIRAEVAADTVSRAPEPRADLRAASDALAAARGDALRARVALLPRLNGFARYDWNSPAGLYAVDRNWTVGVVASWNLFTGASELADVGTTAARADAAQAQAEAARANANLEIEQTRTALSVALTRLAISEYAAAQSAEAHRIVSRKYAGGLAGVVELLDAQAAETQSALALSEARWSAIVAAAERRRALGLDPASLATLDDMNTVTSVAARDARPAGDSSTIPNEIKKP
jgi:outer membrane protein TolC